MGMHHADFNEPPEEGLADIVEQLSKEVGESDDSS